MTQAFLLLTCAYKSTNVKESLENIDGINEIKQVFGAYDYVVKTADMPKKELRKLISEKIRPVENVRSTLTLDTLPEGNRFD